MKRGIIIVNDTQLCQCKWSVALDRLHHVTSLVSSAWTDPPWSTLLLERKEQEDRLVYGQTSGESAVNSRRRTSEQTTNR
jgi:hypothetical protein